MAGAQGPLRAVTVAQQLYLIRHAKADGHQSPEAPLTAEGREQAHALAHLMAPLGVTRIISSPFRRAVDTAIPLAARLGLTVEEDPRLAERLFSVAPRPDWLQRLKESYADPHLALPGAESGQQAQARGLAVITAALAEATGPVALFSHGNLTTLLLHHFDQQYGFAAWQAMTNPDVYLVTVLEEGASVERIWQ